MINNAQRPGISVFFPAYNDAESIGKLVTDALEILPNLTDDYEIIVVNDGSRDRTGEVLRELSDKFSAVRIVEHEINQGYGAALQSGFRHACKDLIFYTDGDGQYDVRELPKLYELLRDEIAVVNGFKLERADKTNRKIIGGLYNQTTRRLFSLPVRDVDCDFRLIRREFSDKIVLHSTSGSICVELVYKLSRAGAVFAEVGVTHLERPFGRSQFFTFRRVSKTLFDVISLWLKLVILRRTY